MKAFRSMGIFIMVLVVAGPLRSQAAKLPDDLKTDDAGWCRVFTWGTNQYPNRAWIQPKKGWTYQSIVTQAWTLANAVSPSQIMSETPIPQGHGGAMKQEIKDISLSGSKGRQIINSIYDSDGNKGYVVALVLSDGTNGWQCYIGAKSTNDIAIGFALIEDHISKTNETNRAHEGMARKIAVPQR